MHNDFLHLALAQAWLGRGSCAPNPAVGAVVVREGRVIAKGWHQRAGAAHAERIALEEAGALAQGSTLYITLEPCTHWGKTPPCVDAIISAGISRVIYGYKDPNPLVLRVSSHETLERVGIKVQHWPLPEIDLFYQSYHHWMITGKPWVTAKIAHSLDGKISSPAGGRISISNEKCAEFTHKQRFHTDVILTTAKTVAADDPLLNARLESASIAKNIAILDRGLKVPATAKVLSSAKHCYFLHASGREISRPLPNCSYHPVAVVDNGLDLHSVITFLGQQGYHDVFVEAGGQLFSALHAAKLVNRTYIYIAPKILGSPASTAYHQDFFQGVDCAISWQIANDNVIACINW